METIKFEVQHFTVETVDISGFPITVNLELSHNGQSFQIKGDNRLDQPIIFVNSYSYGDEPNQSTVSLLEGPENNETIAILNGNSGYIVFQTEDDATTFTGQKITYSLMEMK